MAWLRSVSREQGTNHYTIRITSDTDGDNRGDYGHDVRFASLLTSDENKDSGSKAFETIRFEEDDDFTTFLSRDVSEYINLTPDIITQGYSITLDVSAIDSEELLMHLPRHSVHYRPDKDPRTLETIFENSLGSHITGIIGTSGDDNIIGTSRNETIRGGAGDDYLQSGGGDDTLLGGAGDDVLTTGSGHDILNGGAGIDVINGGWGGDHLFGDGGDDTLIGHSGSDHICGGDGGDVINAGWGDDILFGEDGADRLIGNKGEDVLHGGAGNDTLIGGQGADKFVIDLTTAGDNGSDIIEDFVKVRDKIVFVTDNGDEADLAALGIEITYTNTGSERYSEITDSSDTSTVYAKIMNKNLTNDGHDIGDSSGYFELVSATDEIVPSEV